MLKIFEIECVGCTACASVCAKNVIEIRRNDEGFQYPYIANLADCVECGKCEKVCPVQNIKAESVFEQRGLIAQITDEAVRRESASGGMFSAIALSVLDESGVVFGAAYNADFEVCHIGVSKKEDLWKLRNSKYVQSNLVGVFREIKSILESGRKVCFSGTPCQIEGLQCYLGRNYNNLILVDVVCHGVSSPLIWDKYLETIKNYHPDRIYFRWKHYGYKYSTMSLFDDEHREIYYAGVESDKMLRAYFSNNCDRDTCYDCKFKKRYRTSDFTIWDCFQPGIFQKDFDDDRGTSCVLIHSSKALKQFKKIVNMNLIKDCFVDPDKLVFANNEMVGSVKKGNYREKLLQDASQMSGEDLFNKYFPDTLKTRVKRVARIVLIRTGLYSKIKYQLFKYRRNKLKK